MTDKFDIFSKPQTRSARYKDEAAKQAGKAADVDDPAEAARLAEVSQDASSAAANLDQQVRNAGE